jgi:hypothetical protein
VFQPFFSLTCLIGIVTTVTDPFAATCHHRPFSIIKWQRQKADRTFTKLALIRLRKQITITYFGSPLLACSFVLSPMILLTVDAAIFHEFASSAYLEFHVIDFRFAARSATHHRVGLFFFFVDSAHIIQFAMISSFKPSAPSSPSSFGRQGCKALRVLTARGAEVPIFFL